jgi:triacylglycerol esterase/lipase EstA (alpha/beta hydrolase family)
MTLPPHSQTSSVIVLLSGIMGFDRFFIWRMFDGVQHHFTSLGYSVIQPTISPAASIQERAQEILEKICALAGSETSLHLIGHSMGGLDARYLASPGGLKQGHRILSVTTLSTPHRGSPLAAKIPKRLLRLVGTVSKLLYRVCPLTLEKEYLKKIAQQRWEAFDQLSCASNEAV